MFRRRRRQNNIVVVIVVVEGDGDGCLVKGLHKKFGDSVDVDGVECSRFIRSLRHIYPDDVPILSQVNVHPHNKVVHESVHGNARQIPFSIVEIPSRSVSGPDCRNFPCGNRHHPYDLTFILREIAIGILFNNQPDIVLHIILCGLWLIQMASQLDMAQVVVSKDMVGVEVDATRRNC